MSKSDHLIWILDVADECLSAALTGKGKKSGRLCDVGDNLFRSDRWHFCKFACGVLWCWDKPNLSLLLPNQHSSEPLYTQHTWPPSAPPPKHTHTPYIHTWPFTFLCGCRWTWQHSQCPIMSLYFLWCEHELFTFVFSRPFSLVSKTKHFSWEVINYFQTKAQAISFRIFLSLCILSLFPPFTNSLCSFHLLWYLDG